MLQQRARPILVFVLALPTASLFALPPEFDAAKLAAIRPRMQEFVDRQEVAGAVTAVGTIDRIVSMEAVGVQDLEKRRTQMPDALFRIASMTKPITAIGIMILKEEGKISVEDSVEKHLPEFRGQLLVANRSPEGTLLKKPARPVTVRDLLTHTGGVPNLPEGLSDLYRKRQRTLAEEVIAIAQRPLDFEPGSRWAYSNPGIDTLGRLIEVLSGMSYERFLEERIFRPLGMKDTAFYPTPEQLDRAPVLYDKKDGKLIPVTEALLGSPVGARHPIPAGGLFSTAGDLARLYRMMLGRGVLEGAKVLSPESVEEMTRVHTGDLPAGFTPGASFGYGWCVVREPTGVTSMLSAGSYGHGGAYGTQAWIDPKQGFFVILLIQRAGLPNADASDLRRDLQALAVEALKK